MRQRVLAFDWREPLQCFSKGTPEGVPRAPGRRKSALSLAKATRWSSKRANTVADRTAALQRLQSPRVSRPPQCARCIQYPSATQAPMITGSYLGLVKSKCVEIRRYRPGSTLPCGAACFLLCVSIGTGATCRECCVIKKQLRQPTAENRLRGLWRGR